MSQMNYVRDTIQSINPDKVIRTKIFVPSDTRSFIALPPIWPDNPENPSEILNDFGRLRPQLETSLVKRIEEMDKAANPIDRRFG